jgi:hypothetical protein
MTPEREKQILWYLISLADEYGVSWIDYFGDEYNKYKEEVEPMAYWDAVMFLADKQLAAAGK